MSKIIWLTGLSGSGKSTIAIELHEALTSQNRSVLVIDADAFRSLFCTDLGYTLDDRHKNLMRMSNYALLQSKLFDYVIVAAITPILRMRRLIRRKLGADYIEVFVNTPLDICEKRDPKQLYRRARNGEIAHFTGVSSPYEEPLNPEVTINYPMAIREAVSKITDKIESLETLTSSDAV